MKIVKHGNTYHEIECPKCKARFGYVNNEIKEQYHEGWANESSELYINCPECKNHITLRLIINGEVKENGSNIVRFDTGCDSMRLY